MEPLDVVIVGAGQAGLGLGYHLQQAGRRFVILERGRIGESWRSQRWDSFALNTPNWSNSLPGYVFDAGPGDGFGLVADLVGYFERYTSRFNLPVHERAEVTSVARGDDGFFDVVATGPDGTATSHRSQAVVLASGMMQAPKIPVIGSRLPDSIVQLHTSEYRSPAALPDGAVVVVGAGQSGVQIVEDLLLAQREVYMCTSRVGRVPRRYRGRDVVEWMEALGRLDATVDDLPDPSARYMANVQVSGVGRYGSSLSLQFLAEQGARLMGHLADVAGDLMTTDDSLAANIEFADEFSAQLKSDIDEFIEEQALDAPAPDPDPPDEPASPEVAASGLTELDLGEAGVGAVIWCTGFTAHFEWVKHPLVGEDGHLDHDGVASNIPGLYYLGFPWLRKAKSGVIHGIEEDAAVLAEAIADQLD
jgi:putative flavoprotein involved in K+ transport